MSLKDDVETLRRAYVRGFASSDDAERETWHAEHAALDRVFEALEVPTTARADLTYPEGGPPCGWCAAKEQYLAAANARIVDLVSDRKEARAALEPIALLSDEERARLRGFIENEALEYEDRIATTARGNAAYQSMMEETQNGRRVLVKGLRVLLKMLGGES